ncbi:MAG TPA: hypothetical protein DCL44_01860 [Elusimicrobia bacterium]|nr:hypothetical protein [Elusimicrobiota bacterium]
MKWIVMLLVFVGGIYYLVNGQKAEVRQQEMLSQAKKVTAKAVEEQPLPQKPETTYTIKFSLSTLKTLRNLTQDPNEKVRFAAVELLWQLQDEQIPRVIRMMFDQETEPAVKKSIIDMLAKDKSRLSLGLISGAIKDYDKETRLKAVEAIGTFSNKEAILALTPAMEDYDDAIRLKALEAVKRIRQDIQANKEQKMRELEMKPIFRVE